MKEDRIFHFTKHFLEKELQRGIKKTGVKKISIHSLRHSHASLLLELGVPILEVRDRLGHEKIETTLNTYAHQYKNKQDVLADKLEEIIRKDGIDIWVAQIRIGFDNNKRLNNIPIANNI